MPREGLSDEHVAEVAVDGLGGQRGHLLEPGVIDPKCLALFVGFVLVCLLKR